eukprot:GSMAST32.ASY1.ANO1.716.1 assembled CDS
MASVNTLLAIISLLYIVVNVACAILNCFNNDCDPTELDCSPATTPFTFHALEFGATFVFNTVDVFALSYAPMTLSNQYRNPTLLKLVVLFNVCVSALAFLLVLINLHKFEIFSHELEYSNEVTIAIFDAIILLNLLEAIQLSIYNFSGWKDGKSNVPAHFLEFFFGVVSAGITFWFTMDNKIVAEKRLRDIMYETNPIITPIV